MSGLFRRLTRRASGHATTLHAPARLPFHAAPAATEALDTANAYLSADAPSPTVAVPIRSRTTSPQASVKTESPEDIAPRGSTLPSARNATGATSAVEMHGDVDPPDASLQPANPARADRPTDQSTRRALASVSEQEVPALIAPRLSAETPPRTAASANPAPGTATHGADHGADRMVTKGATDAAATRESPPTLLPSLLPTQLPIQPSAPQATADGARARSKAADRANVRAPNTADDGPNEVHVHIGRIEVTAVQQPAPKPRAKKRGPEPMSLDDYIARREGKSP